MITNRGSVVRNVLVSLVLGLLLGACQLFPTPAVTEVGTPEPTIDLFLPTDQTPQITPQPTSSQTEPDVQVISIWMPPQFDPDNGTEAGNLLKSRLATFAEDYPQVEIKVRLKAVSGSGGLLDSLTTTSSAAAAGLPGLILLNQSDFETAALKGLIFAVDTPENTVDDADWYAYAKELSTVQETRYGLPFAGDALVMAYRPLQTSFPPRYWQEISQQKAVFSFPAADPQSLVTTCIYLGAGGSFADEVGNFNLQQNLLQKSLQVHYEAAAAEAFPYWLAQFETFEQSWQSFLESRSSFSFIWASQFLLEKPENIAITALPSFSSGPLTLADGWILAIPDTSSERFPLNLKLAEYLTDPAFHQKWVEAAGMLPTQRTLLNSWSDQELAYTLNLIAESAIPVPSNQVINQVGLLFEKATTELIKKQISYYQATDTILEKLPTQP